MTPEESRASTALVLPVAAADWLLGMVGDDVRQQSGVVQDA